MPVLDGGRGVLGQRVGKRLDGSQRALAGHG